jgi:3-oxoadipate enol-lactonase / 4-carboxymuconolactone decarboxylase
MSLPQLAAVELVPGPVDRPLLVLGPSLGTLVSTLWRAAAQRLGQQFRVLGWDFPGHGNSAPAGNFTVGDIAVAVLAAVDAYAGEPTMFGYAGDSLGGAVGLQLMLDTPERVAWAVLCCTGPRIGEPEGWRDRVAAVRSGGTAALLDSAPGRWFAPGYMERDPQTAAALLNDLAACDDESYAAACEALAEFDVRTRLPEIAAPLLAVAGAHDATTPAPLLRHLAAGVQQGRLAVLDGVAHLAPAEAPDRLAALIAGQATTRRSARTTAQVRAEGMRVRREVLGDVHVDRALEQTTDLTRDFQDFITTYAWGGVWTRGGLDRRSRSLVTLAALVARGHHEELAMHIRAARRNGLTDGEIAEALLQTAIYCGVPDANTAFRIAQQVFIEPIDELP